MKKLLSLLLSVSLCFGLAGCSSATPLKEKLIVEGIGVDWEDDQFKVTLQVYSPSADNKGQSDYQLFNAYGTTVYEALRRIDENTGKHSYFSDTEVVVFSLDSLKQSLWHNLEYFIRSNEMSTNVCMAATTQKAEDLFSIEKEGLNMPSKVISNALHYGKTGSKAFSGELMTVSSRLLVSEGDISLPMLETEEYQDKTYLRQSGVLCFRKEQPTYRMTETEKWVYNWLHEYYDERGFVFHFDGDVYATHIKKATSRVTASLENGVPCFAIALELDCDLLETNTSEGIVLTRMKELQDSLAEQINQLTLQTIERVFLQKQCDVFEFGRVLKKQQPDYFKQCENWRAVIPNCRFTCETEAVVVRAGQGNVE